jgi:hypothetical protein
MGRKRWFTLYAFHGRNAMQTLPTKSLHRVALFSIILAQATVEARAAALYSVKELGLPVSQQDLNFGPPGFGWLINIDSAGIVSLAPYSTYATGPVPAGDTPNWQVTKTSDNGQYVVGTAERQ